MRNGTVWLSIIILCVLTKRIRFLTMMTDVTSSTLDRLDITAQLGINILYFSYVYKNRMLWQYAFLEDRTQQELHEILAYLRLMLIRWIRRENLAKYLCLD